MPELADPWFLLLLPVPILAWRLLPRRPPHGAALALPSDLARGILARAHADEGPLRRRWLLPAFVWLCLVVALTGPRQLAPVPALEASGRDLAIALDLSGSMVRDDFVLDGAPITRLDAVKRVGAAFARRRAGDRVALIVFGSDAYYAAPFTYDTEAVARRIETAEIGISGRATNIVDAMGLALGRLDASEAATRVVVLLSDGVANAGATNPRGVARLAAEMGVRVHTIALGPEDMSSVAPGTRGAVDAATLADVAEIAGGETFRVRDMADLETLGRALDALEPTAGDGLAAEVRRELWVWPAGLAVLLSLGLAVRGTE